MIFGRLIEEILNEENVTISKVIDAIDSHKRIMINYKSDGGDDANGPRIAELYAYGLTKSGNPVVRAFQPYGDTTTSVPNWKMFRLDRITSWKDTGQTFDHPASDDYNVGDFNEHGDKTMATVYKIAEFDKETIYRTDTEKAIDRLQRQIDNPIRITDIQKATSDNITNKANLKNAPQHDAEDEPKEPDFSQPDNEPENDVFIPDGEREMRNGFDSLNKQLENPTYINQNGEEYEVEDVPIDDEEEDDIYHTDTETRMKNLLDKLNNGNVQKIDLSKIPKR